jgi:hypothetical protein
MLGCPATLQLATFKTKSAGFSPAPLKIDLNRGSKRPQAGERCGLGLLIMSS